MAQQVSVAERLNLESFPRPAPRLQRRETPISWLLLTGAYAYKIKKPVRLPFIDASTLERREFLCREELRLNRRFASDLYLDVLPISEQGGQLRVGGPGTPVEYAVRMRQFETSQELGEQLASGRIPTSELAAFGRQLARWHEAAPAAAPQDPYATVALIGAQVRENFATLRGRVHGPDAARLSRLEQWTGRELARLAQLLVQRKSSGRVRECHGDLHAGNIVRWQGAWVPFDCLEFEPRLRWIDVISDVAFLFMDLMGCAHEELAYAFLAAYLEESGDYEALRLLPFYSVYRALVRAKVDALSFGSEPTLTTVAAQTSAARLRERLQIAERLACAPAPALLLMHGVTASGKSFLSTRLITAVRAVRVRSDLERQRLFGSGAYSAAQTAATYERLRNCAQSAIEGGYRIIVDATFLDRTRRDTFEQLAERQRCPFLIVSCSAPPNVLRARLADRAHGAQDASEATVEVLEHQLAAPPSIDERERAALIQVDTSDARAIARAVDAIRARLTSRAS